ncbi:thiolase family protein [Arthrobacter koreensis]|uniref:thiolase family protein n=1 Tax=Arthrobacter koreensis TaxID=199136 RepID=UPI002DB82F90|nr:thiolase family protein [Arthrobacter koreensis]MEB7448188.1 thiolase family protein [Arthrobacter koreensis]
MIAERSVAITGIGLSEVGRPAQSSALRLTVDAALQAIADAGLEVADIDGISTYPGASNTGPGFAPVGAQDLRLALGMEVSWYSSAALDSPSQFSAVANAIGAVSAGLARHVLVFRTISEATSRLRDKQGQSWAGSSDEIWGFWEWTAPYGVESPVPWYATYAQRYMYDHGLTEEQLGAVAVNARRMAAGNPAAIYRDPLSLEDYLQGRSISWPLRIFDCDVPVDGSVAFVVSRLDDAHQLFNPPLRFEAIGTAMGAGGLRDPLSLSSFGAEKAASMLWERSRIPRGSVRVAEIYDGMSILTVHWLEALGFCAPGAVGAFIEGGENIGLKGRLPLNTGGGQLSAGRLHGLGHLHEACTQLWGRGGARQVPNEPDIAAVSMGAYGLGCALLVRED